VFLSLNTLKCSLWAKYSLKTEIQGDWNTKTDERTVREQSRVTVGSQVLLQGKELTLPCLLIILGVLPYVANSTPTEPLALP
jgi:hypothetical protein